MPGRPRPATGSTKYPTLWVLRIISPGLHPGLNQLGQSFPNFAIWIPVFMMNFNYTLFFIKYYCVFQRNMNFFYCLLDEIYNVTN